MSDDNGSRGISIDIGVPWLTMWIFTIAFAHLSFGQGVLGALIWPYYLGEAIATAIGRCPLGHGC